MSNSFVTALGFHELTEKVFINKYLGHWVTKEETAFRYSFENFFHPFTGELIEQLNKKSLTGLFDAGFHQGLRTKFFDSIYAVQASDVVSVEHYPKEIDVRPGGPYSNYNWELLFHVPLTIAVHLSKNQRFAEARRWFHYIFDPTSNDIATPVPKRFWKFLAFRRSNEVKQIDEQLRILSDPNGDSQEKKWILRGYDAIKNKPFHPHAVAQARQLAYQYSVVMKYLDNLIAWGDSLFRRDTVESINEATQLYVLASNILGHRPQRVPQTGTVRPKTFAELKEKRLDPMGNTLVELEGKFPLNLGMPQMSGGDPDAAGPLFGIGRTLYFCIPRNEKLLSYWDTVADRLFKIRHCMNIEGVVRQLALFDPPIDPGMLVKAVAAGIDIGSIVNGMNQPVTPVRSLFLIQKALELCSEVRSLGSALLSAIEKGDGERLSLLRQSHEIKIQQMQQEVRLLQWKQAQESTRSLLTNRASALERLNYYKRVLGLASDPNAPDTLPLSFATSGSEEPKLNEANFDQVYGALVGQFDKNIAREKLPDLALLDEGKLKLLAGEFDDLNKHSEDAQDARLRSTRADQTASIFSAIPAFDIEMQFWGLGASSRIAGGQMLADAARAVSSQFSLEAQNADRRGQNASKKASYERSADDRILQHNLAVHELKQIGRQILTSLIAEQTSHHEYKTLTKQIENGQEADRFLHDKFSNEELYAWMQGETSRLYYEYYRFAFDTARKAERSMKHELMRQEVDATDFIKFNYWDGGRKGLLSGEALYLDVKRMELAYHENNRREYELVKNVSIRRLNPMALMLLKATGTCEVTIPEWVFDLDTPGHYMRRVKSVGVTIPAVVGPYSSVYCTLTLLKSSLRTSSLVGEGYARSGSEDTRFVDYFSSSQSIVTSSGQSDAGMFETNLRDDRPLPFEGSGVASTWKLELPMNYPSFDHATISDIVLQFRYTARRGIDPGEVKKALDDMFAAPDKENFALLFPLKEEFPTEWSSFINTTEDFKATIRRDHFPYFTQGREVSITGFDLYAQDGITPAKHKVTVDLSAASDDLNEKGEFTIAAPKGNAPQTEILKKGPGPQLFLVVRYSF